MNDQQLEDALRVWGSTARANAPAVDVPTFPDGPHRPSWLVPSVIAAAVALVAVVSLLIVTGTERDAATSPETTATAAAPSPAPGFRTVSYHGLAMDVPDAWSTNGTECSTPVENTVVIDNGGAVLECSSGPVPGVSAVGFTTDSGATPSIPGFPLNCCSAPAHVVPPTATQQIDLDGTPAVRYDNAPIADFPFFTTFVRVPSHGVLVVVQSPDQSLVDHIAGSLRVQPVDGNGCASSADDVAELPAAPVGSTRAGMADAVIPTGTDAVTVCRYTGGGLVGSVALSQDQIGAFVDAVNSAAEGTSHSDDPLVSCDTSNRTSSQDGYRILVRYPDSDPLIAVARIAFCGDLGISNGDRTSQMTYDLAIAIATVIDTGTVPTVYQPNP